MENGLPACTVVREIEDKAEKFPEMPDGIVIVPVIVLIGGELPFFPHPLPINITEAMSVTPKNIQFVLFILSSFFNF
jgi:hypothetical protein